MLHAVMFLRGSLSLWCTNTGTHIHSFPHVTYCWLQSCWHGCSPWQNRWKCFACQDFMARTVKRGFWINGCQSWNLHSLSLPDRYALSWELRTPFCTIHSILGLHQILLMFLVRSNQCNWMVPSEFSASRIWQREDCLWLNLVKKISVVIM